MSIPKIQELVMELEVGLGSASAQTRTRFLIVPLTQLGEEGEEQVHGILTAMDEYQFWSEVGTSSNRLQAKERAHFFQELLQPLAAEFANLDSLSFSDGLELVDETQNTLDDLWKQADHHPPYPEKRMIHLL